MPFQINDHLIPIESGQSVGRSFAEAGRPLRRNRGWVLARHINQTLRWDGTASDGANKDSRATIGIETVIMGYARPGLPADKDWVACTNTMSREELRVQPWASEQIVMVIAVGTSVVGGGRRSLFATITAITTSAQAARTTSLDSRSRRCQRFYGVEVPEVWVPLAKPKQRQRALCEHGFSLGTTGVKMEGVDGIWERSAMRP